MEIQYFGGNCVKITSKKSSIVIDDNLAALGQKQIVTDKDVAVYTTNIFEPSDKSLFNITGPGEYEVADISIQGVAARAHTDEEKAKTATLYRIIMDDMRIATVGHIYPEISDEQLEALGTIDILFVPVGG